MKNGIAIFTVSGLLSASVGIVMIMQFFTLSDGNGAGFWYINDVLLIALPMASIISIIVATIEVRHNSATAIKTTVRAFHLFISHMIYSILLGGLGLVAAILIAAAVAGPSLLQVFILAVGIGLFSFCILIRLWTSFIANIETMNRTKLL